MSERYLRAYYHTFDPTGDDSIDAILEAVAMAGKAYHSTSDWSDADQYGPHGYWSLIQMRAEAAARVRAEANAEEPVAWGEDIDGKIVSVRLDKSRHCTVPLYPAPEPSGWKPIARPLEEWHEDYGDAVWWTWQDGQWLGEPSYIGTPNDSDWPGYHTHWTPHPIFPTPPTAGGGDE